MHAFRHQPSEALMSLCQFRLAGERIRPRQVEPPAIYTIRGRHHLIQTPLLARNYPWCPLRVS